MRWIIRIGASALLGVVTTLLMLTTETAADELGYVSGVRSIVRNGWRAMIDAGYSDWLVRLFWLVLGIVLAMWWEYGLRKWEARKRHQNWAHITVELADDRNDMTKRTGVDTATILDGQVMGNLYPRAPAFAT